MRACFCATRGSTLVSAEARDIRGRLRCQRLFCAQGPAVYGESTVLRASLSVQLGAGASGYSCPLAGPGGNW